MALSLPFPAQGWGVLVCVVVYVAALLWACRSAGQADLFALAGFLAMAAMWVAPLFAAVALSRGRPGRAAALSGAFFLGAELLAPSLGLWEPVGATHRLLGVAVYVVPAEAALGWAAAAAFARVRHRSLATRIGAALAVSTFYLGALVLSHFLIDVAGWRLSW